MATACAKPLKGRARWTLTLLAGEMVGLTEHETLLRETVRRRLISLKSSSSSRRDAG